MWKIQQAMQDDAIRTIWTHPAFIPVTCLKCSYGKISSPLTEISVGKNEVSGTDPARPLIQTHRSVFGLGKWYANSRTGKCRPGIAVTISTNQFHLHKNDHEWGVVRYTQILLKMALNRSPSLMGSCFEEIENEFPFGIFRPEKQDYPSRCSVAPGNFPLERTKKSCSCSMFVSLCNK